MSLKKKRKLAAVLFADIASYTAIMQEDEARASRLLEKFRNTFHDFVERFDGKIIQFYGDGCLCIFGSSIDAVGCARDIQLSLLTAPLVPVRMGVHCGDVFFEADNVYGDSVNIASRIESIGTPGSVLMSDRVAMDLKNHPEFRVKLIGSYALKNVQATLKIFALTNTGLVVPQSPASTGIIGQIAGKKQSTNNLSKLAWTLGIGAIIFLLGFVLYPYLPNSIPSFAQESTVAVMPFENNTGDSSFNIVGKMATDRIVHGITQNDLASVITSQTLEEYDNVLLASTTASDPITIMRNQFGVSEVINGHIYIDQQDLIFECTISDTKSKKVVRGMEAVRSPKTDPMQGIEKMRQLVLGFLASRQDRALDLLLETHIPKLEAYRELELAKAAEDPERVLIHLNRAIEIDSNYFEPKVLRLSWYYNKDEFQIMDSLRNKIHSDPLQSDKRQQNLLNFYDALLEGKNDLAYQFMHKEYSYAPFHLETNTTMIVLALQFVYEVKDALSVYQKIPGKNMDYSNCANCRVRLYLKAYIDIERGLYNDAIEASQQLYKYASNNMGIEIIIKSYAYAGQFNELNNFISSLEGNNTVPSQAGLYLDAAKACLIAGKADQSALFIQQAEKIITPETDRWTAAEVYLLMEKWDTSSMILKELLESNPFDYKAMGYLAGILFKEENTGEAHKFIRQLDQQKKPYQFGEIDYRVAQAYAMGNHHEAAILHLQKAVALGQRFSFGQFQYDFIFNTIRHEEAFVDILKYWQ